MNLESFRRAPSLVLTTAKQKLVTTNGAGLLLANPTAAKLEANGDLAIQVNGTFHAAAKVQKATKTDAVRLLRNPLDPALHPDDRARLADDVEFLESLATDIVD